MPLLKGIGARNIPRCLVRILPNIGLISFFNFLQ